ncbi:radical SAM protein [Patescibacteria group bacterium]|nr:radical SAM protein [Patescibacteria group bacterium]
MKHPHTLLLDVTTQCNLCCPYCFGPKKGSKKDRSLEELKEEIKEASKNGFKVIIISGGEPLLRKDIPQLIKLAKEDGLYTILHTNGILLTKNLVDKLEPHLDQLNLPLDGFDEISNDALRGEGHYKKVVKAMDLIRGRDIKMVVSTVANSRNREFISKIAEIIPEWTFKWRVFQFKQTKQVKAEAAVFEIPDNEFNKISETIKNIPKPFEVEMVPREDKLFYKSYTER